MSDSHPKYRADIDGLRAIAVIAVVIFHAFPVYAPGGFVGVDIFFVISGFLISTVIFGSLKSDNFSFVEFYSRRVKRIYPALLLVLLACFTFGWFVLMADEYAQLNKHIIGAAGFVSNFILWNESGYFDNAAETKPLLHLWSLGIEEQFYIIWPVLLWASWKKRFNLLTIASLAAIVSFALNIKGIHKDISTTFYLPLTRFWELVAGSILAYVTLFNYSAVSRFKNYLETVLQTVIYKTPLKNSNNLLYNLQALFGVVLILFSISIINSKYIFPGWWALLPVFGSVLIIDAGTRSWLNRNILSNRALVWIGLISYPLYLWHWPLLSFARIIEGELPSVEIRSLLILISILLALMTYKLIEKPIRLGNQGKTKTIALLISMTFVGGVGYSCYKWEGLKFRQIAKSTAKLSEAKEDWEYKTTTFKNSKIEEQHTLIGSSKESVLFIGDSLMGQYFPRASKIYAPPNPLPYYSTVFASRNHCAPMPNFDLVSPPENIKCGDYYLAAIAQAKKQVFKKIVFAGMWPDPNFENVLDKNHEKLIEDLLELKKLGKQVYLISRAPHSPLFNPTNLAKPLRKQIVLSKLISTKNIFYERSVIEEQDKASLAMLTTIANRGGATVINPYDYFCFEGKCPALIDSSAMYSDDYHIRASHAKKYATFIDLIVNTRSLSKL